MYKVASPELSPPLFLLHQKERWEDLHLHTVASVLPGGFRLEPVPLDDRFLLRLTSDYLWCRRYWWTGSAAVPKRGEVHKCLQGLLLLQRFLEQL